MTYFTAPFGPWGVDPSTGRVGNTYFENSTFFSWGAPPYQGTVGSTIDGATNLPFASLIFDNSPNIWADNLLGAGEMVASVWQAQSPYTDITGMSPGLHL